MNFCSNCGKKIITPSNFCDNCGKNLQINLSADKSEIKENGNSSIEVGNYDLKIINQNFEDLLNETSKEIQSIKIGNQVWSKNNFDMNTYQNGDLIPHVEDNNEWKKLSTGAWCFYENNVDNTFKYGKLYNWYTINDPRGFAPIGWRIPTDNDWLQLINYLGGKELAGKRLREIEGFYDIAGGYRQMDGGFSGINQSGNFWSSSESNENGVQCSIHCNEYNKRDWTELHLKLLGVPEEKNPFFNRFTNGHKYSKNGGFSIRLIKI
jgi:uncharacterized protein (TIGR02145 family)